MTNMKPFEFEVVEHIATLSTSGTYTTELNRVAFRDYPPKLDLRTWHNGEPLKGIRLSDDEARALMTALEGVFNGEEVPS